MATFEFGEVTGDGPIEVTTCDDCPFAHGTMDEWGYYDGRVCVFGRAPDWNGPPPDDCPLREGEQVVRLRAIGGEL